MVEGKLSKKNGYFAIANKMVELTYDGPFKFSELRTVFYILRWSWGIQQNEWTGPISIRNMARNLKMTPPNLVRILKNLEQNNVIIIDRSKKRNRYKIQRIYKKWFNPQINLKL